MLTERTEKWWKESLKAVQDLTVSKNAVQFSTTNSHIVLEVDPTSIETISTHSLNITSADKILENYSKRQIPRFR